MTLSRLAREEIEAQFTSFETYPEKFGAALVTMERMQRKIDAAEQALSAILRGSPPWSGRLCRDYAEAALDGLRKM